MSVSNSDPVEIDKFSIMAKEWWDKNGPCKPLHDINPIRLQFIEGQIATPGQRGDCEPRGIAAEKPSGNTAENSSAKTTYSQQWDFQQGAAKASNRNVCEIHEDCEPSGNTAENSSAKTTN
jgi:2-polyprenyl-3-methyl-5-hydroxy-6-metoxy-1,4-benzoquinol methylase